MDIWTIGEWVGKVGFVSLFIVYGTTHLVSRPALTGYAASKGVPMPGAFVVITGVMMLAGSAMILLKWHTLWGVGLLVVFLWTVAIVMHNFWAIKDPATRVGDQAHFFKDLALGAGAILYGIAVHRGAF